MAPFTSFQVMTKTFHPQNTPGEKKNKKANKPLGCGFKDFVSPLHGVK